jgi:CRISPR-associated protein Csx17
MNAVPVPGCRHNILGHHLKAFGLLRVLATCAEPQHRDPDVEGWWDLSTACFYLRSQKYPSEEQLVEFLAKHYRPTPIFSPWNTGGGLDEKQELVLKIDRKPVAQFLWENRRLLRQHGYKANKHSWKDGKLSFDLKNGSFTVRPPQEMDFRIETTSGRRPKQKVVLQWASSMIKDFSDFLSKNLKHLGNAASIPKTTEDKLKQNSFTEDELCLTIKSLDAVKALHLKEWILQEIRTKTSGEKATIAVVRKHMAYDDDIIKAIQVGHRYFAKFQTADSSERRKLLESFRDELPSHGVLAMDAVLTSRTEPDDNNPLFLKRGEAGNSEIFRSFWSYFLAFKNNPADSVMASLFPRQSSLWDKEKSPGTPFFPDAIKTYNNGLGWIAETFPFNATDYLLAVEGALALRGAVSRTLVASSRRFAAFPFIFDTGDDFVDETNEVKGTASSVWLPLWERPVTFAELESFICDAQARLPRKEARFSAEFARAIRFQGVDAGFSGWQEFRFKMKASRIPWVCTGRYLSAVANRQALHLNNALAPLDESGFFDQFEPRYKGNNIESRSPHTIRAALNAAIEEMIAEPTPEGALEILVRLYGVCRQIALSESFRDTLRGRRAVFFDALPQEPWEHLLHGLEQLPEFRIARALASITGLERQQRRTNEKPTFSEVQPFLGSLLPIKRGPTGWYLPTDSKGSFKQAVWSGTDICNDLAHVLSRRYLDSLDDDLPALRSPQPAPLTDILMFLHGKLDDHRIARWTEALSLIGWQWGNTGQKDTRTKSEESPSNEQGQDDWQAIPPAYAALRTLLEVECEWQGNDISQWQKRRSQQPIALLCQRSPSSLALAVEEALRWLSVWGVPNCWTEQSRCEKPRLSGRDIIRANHRIWRFDHDPQCVRRLASAVAIPLDWRNRWKLYHAVTLPQTV